MSNPPCETNERSPLLGQRDHQLCDQKDTGCWALGKAQCLNYRFQKIREKGAVLMIVWNAFFAVSLLSVGTDLAYGRDEQIVVCSLTLLYPVIGWLADCCIGRYRVLKVASYSLLLSIILKGIYKFILEEKITVLLFFTSSIWSVSVVCYLACIFQFAIDQSVGASGEELSFTIHWILWGITSGEWLADAVKYPFAFHSVVSSGLVRFIISLVGFCVAHCLMECRSSALETKPQLSNPIKKIFKVLNYARKHDCPQRRSALTYWDGDYPSRIDFGKDKYGGPFSVEEVEDVKTVLRLIPIAVCAMAFGIGMWKGEFFHVFKIHRTCYNASKVDVINTHFHSQLFHNSTFIACCLATLSVPIYHFLIYPIFYNYIPSMLRRIGAGLFLLFVSFLANSVIEVIGQVQSSNSSCMFDANHLPVPLDCSWTLIPEVIGSAGIVLTFFSLVEFLIAQTPWQIKGFLVCVAVSAFGIFTLAGLGLDMLLMNVPIRLFPGCGFFYYGIYTIVTFVIFVVFVIISKWYKLRRRDDVVPYHMFAEEYFEKNYKLEQQYLLQKYYEYLKY